MKVVDVIPLSKGIGKETLSYFSSKKVSLGSLVTVPVRKKATLGIVIAIHDAAKLKAYLKSSDYKLRNVSTVHKTSPFNTDFLKTCIRLKNHSTARTGSLLAAYTPKIILDHIEEIAVSNETPERNFALLPERYIFQAPFADRISYYKTLIREQFANKKSVFICTPTQAHAEALHNTLEKGIEDRVISCHTGMTKKQLVASIKTVLSNDQPIVVIGTANFLLLVRPNTFSTIVTEFEGSGYYRRQDKPHVDSRDFIYTYAYMLGVTFIVADELVQTNTMYRSEKEYFTPIKPTHFKIKKRTPIHFTYPKKKEFDEKTYPFLAKNILTTLKSDIKNNERIVIFTPRKGLAPLSVCQDCGTIVTDPHDETTPLVLHETGRGNAKKRFYHNHKTGEKFEATDACRDCGGWRIKQLGISTGSMAEYLEHKLGKNTPPLYIVDGTATPTHTKTKKTLSSWQESGGILITTEKSIPYLINTTASTVIIASLESLLASPAYTSHERIARLVLSFADSATQHTFVQSRDTHLPILSALEKGNLTDWYKQEIKERTQFSYPPFGTIIKIETYGTKSATDKKYAKLEKALDGIEHTINVYKSGYTKQQQYRLVAVIRLDDEQWLSLPAAKQTPETYMDIFSRLQSLPEHFYIHINPESLL